MTFAPFLRQSTIIPWISSLDPYTFFPKSFRLTPQIFLSWPFNSTSNTQNYQCQPTSMRCFWTRSLKSCPPRRLLPAIASVTKTLPCNHNSDTSSVPPPEINLIKMAQNFVLPSTLSTISNSKAPFAFVNEKTETYQKLLPVKGQKLVSCQAAQEKSCPKTKRTT